MRYTTVEPLYIAATLGEQHFGRYIGVAFIERFTVVL